MANGVFGDSSSTAGEVSRMDAIDDVPKLARARAISAAGFGPSPGTVEASHWTVVAWSRPDGRARSAAGRHAASATPGRAIKLVDDVGAAVLVSLLGEPHVALRQLRPLHPQHRALFAG